MSLADDIATVREHIAYESGSAVDALEAMHRIEAAKAVGSRERTTCPGCAEAWRTNEEHERGLCPECEAALTAVTGPVEITDEMVDRAIAAWSDTGWIQDAMRDALRAALSGDPE